MSHFVRLAERERPEIRLTIDGAPATALAGDTLMTAILTSHPHLRRSEFGGGPRAGFCMMGACQDCWIRLADGTRLRACSTPAEDGMEIRIETPEEDTWPTLG